MRRYLFFIMIVGFLLMITSMEKSIQAKAEKESIILEVEGDAHAIAESLTNDYSEIEVIIVFDLLFNGVALKAPEKTLEKLKSEDFVEMIHPVNTYDLPETSFMNHPSSTDKVLPSDINVTPYTGKEVKVAVIDTGIDYNHPDLAVNYAGGFDLVDLNDDPMETTSAEGIPTNHGTHVAGIIAANGALKGVAPEADIYAYRALGSGGIGTSIQVIAAMEQAVKDDVDIINLSLGNSVNGPDYPTSAAVNQAVDQGIAVVIANGNAGPSQWTVGAPATAYQALSVGASTMAREIPYLFIPQTRTELSFVPMEGSIPWQLRHDYPIAYVENIENIDHIRGKIALYKRGGETFFEKAHAAEQAGAVAVIIFNDEDGPFQGSVLNHEQMLQIPVVSMTKEDGEMLINLLQEEAVYVETLWRDIAKSVAPFSSRGPVTLNWQIKPDVLAPGTNIYSTVPGGYETLQGTSMAAPHVSGAIALMKEAKPEWTMAQIVSALKTTASPLRDKDNQLLPPNLQGMGEIQIEEALRAETLIDQPLLSFGRMDGYRQTETITITIENMTDQGQTFYFDVPKKERGYTWKIPLSFSLAPYESTTVPIELSIHSNQLEQGLYEGWLRLHEGRQTYHLPYNFVNQTADFPTTAGFEFSLKPLSEETYVYRIYMIEEAKRVTVNLYDPDRLFFERQLLTVDEPIQGINEGEIERDEVGEPGLYKAVMTVELKDDTFVHYDLDLIIE